MGHANLYKDISELGFPSRSDKKPQVFSAGKRCNLVHNCECPLSTSEKIKLLGCKAPTVGPLE